MGNPLIKEEMELQSKIKDLKMEKNRFSENLYDMQDKIRVKYPQKIRQLELQIKHNSTDLETANTAEFTFNEDNKKVYPITINGTVYNDRKEGGNAIKNVIAENFAALSSSTSIEVGEYRCLKLSLQYSDFNKNFIGCLSGEKPHYCTLNPSTDIGNIVRLDNCINNIADEIKKTDEEIVYLKKDLETMQEEVDKPFPKADELLQAETRLEEVHIELSAFELEDDSNEKDLYERLCDIFSELMSGDTNSVCCHLENRDITAEMQNDNIILTDKIKGIEFSKTIHIDYVNEKAAPAFNGVDSNSSRSIYVAIDKLLDEFEFFDFQDNAKTIQCGIAI